MEHLIIVKYSKSHNLHIDDALIAATAIKMNIELITYNISDFRYIPDLNIYRIDLKNGVPVIKSGKDF